MYKISHCLKTLLIIIVFLVMSVFFLQIFYKVIMMPQFTGIKLIHLTPYQSPLKEKNTPFQKSASFEQLLEVNSF